MTDGMISVSTATLSCVLELLRCWTRTTMPYQIAFWAVWLMAWASHSSRKLRLRQIDRSLELARRGAPLERAVDLTVGATLGGATTCVGARVSSRRPSDRAAPRATGTS